MNIKSEALKSATALLGRVEGAGKTKLELTSEANRKARSVPRMTQMLEQVIKMAQTVLGVEAASILLFRACNIVL